MDNIDKVWILEAGINGIRQVIGVYASRSSALSAAKIVRGESGRYWEVDTERDLWFDDRDDWIAINGHEVL